VTGTTGVAGIGGVGDTLTLSAVLVLQTSVAAALLASPL
jgi:hypothetical protein